MLNLLTAFLGLEQRELILLGAVLVSVAVILFVVVIIAKTRKKKRGKTSAIEEVEGLEEGAENEPTLAQDEILEEQEDVNADDYEEGEEDDAQSDDGEDSLEEAGEENCDEPIEKQEKAVKNTTKVYHVSKRKSDGKWQVKMSKGARAIKLFSTQLGAIDYAKKLAVSQEARIIIHKEDGSFRKLTYKSKK